MTLIKIQWLSTHKNEASLGHHIRQILKEKENYINTGILITLR